MSCAGFEIRSLYRTGPAVSPFNNGRAESANSLRKIDLRGLDER